MRSYYSKFKNKKTVVDGISFASKLEASRYKQLKEMEQQGEIKNLVLQPKFELQEPFVKKGKKYRKIEYFGDFMYEVAKGEKSGEIVIEDTKGLLTQEFKLKQKLFEYKYPQYHITLVKKVNKYGKNK